MIFAKFVCYLSRFLRWENLKFESSEGGFRGRYSGGGVQGEVSENIDFE